MSPLFVLGRIVYLRLRGFSGATRIPLDGVESANVGTTEIRWYFKTRRDVPVLLVEYRVDGDARKRRIMFRPRYDDTDVARAVDAFEAASVPVELTDGVRALLD